MQIQSRSGYLLLELIEGGVHFRCQINVSSGHAELNHDVRWADGTSKHRAGKTPIQQPGKHKLLFANVDDQLLLWVDEELISFDGTTSYDRERDVIPKWTNDDPLDLAPVRIGSDGLALTVHRLRVLRDVYYLATTNESPPYDYDGYFTPDQIHDIFDNPFMWNNNTLFQARRMVEFESGQDEYFPLGDNSQYSQDARYWENAAVNRDFLIGRALLVYWPRGNGMLPDFERFRLIR